MDSNMEKINLEQNPDLKPTQNPPNPSSLNLYKCPDSEPTWRPT